MGNGRISTKQQEILEYIKEQILSHGYPPTVRDICQAVNLRSTSSVQDVYKRQSLDCPLTIQLNAISGCESASFSTRSVISVSYTHLDVYKRQAYDFCITDKMSRLLHIESHNLQYCDILLHSGSAVIPYFKYFSTDAYTASVSERPVRLSLIHIQMCIRDRCKVIACP